MDERTPDISLESWLVSAGRDSEAGAPLNVPLIPASNFIIGSGREYARDDGTKTWEALESIVGGLEGGRAVAFASGMASIAAVFDQLRAGAVVVLPDDCYQGVASLAVVGAEKGRWSVRRVAVEDTSGWIRESRTADLIWLESPSNPLLTVADLAAICGAPRKPGAIVFGDVAWTIEERRRGESGFELVLTGGSKRQTLYAADYTDEGGWGVEWVGDLDGDGTPDLILSASHK